MKALLFGLAALASAGTCVAQTSSSQQVGTATYGQTSNGVTWSSQRVGANTYGNASNGVNWSTQQVGSQTYGNASNGTSWSSQRVGSNVYGSDSKGTTGQRSKLATAAIRRIQKGTQPRASRSGRSFIASKCERRYRRRDQRFLPGRPRRLRVAWAELVASSQARPNSESSAMPNAHTIDWRVSTAGLCRRARRRNFRSDRTALV